MVEAYRKEKLVAVLRANQHEIISDVKAQLGGTDQGLNPHELLEASLSACTIITVQMYADRHAMPLKSTHVRVHISKEGPETELQREIRFEGDLTDEQKARLLEIAGKCPIHRLLSSHITITTSALT